jgi:hypothetical protein
MKFKVTILVLASSISIQANASGPIYNKGGLGCGTIVSMRDSTQKPISSELADDYNAPRSSGGFFGQILANIPGVGLLAAAVGDAVADAVVHSVSSSLKEADMAKQAEVAKFKDFKAVEFKFDDGEVVNIPVYVVSGMLYKAGRRLNAMSSPKYGNLTLGLGVMFSSEAELGGSDYSTFCRIDNVEARTAALAPFRNLVDESQIVNASERREVVAAAAIPPVAVNQVAAPEAVAPQ